MPEPRTIRMTDHHSWGNTVDWWTAAGTSGRGRIHGWLPRRPQPGDRFISPMKSGRNGIYEVTADGHTFPTDPPDQFFVSVQFVGYEDTDA